MGIFSRKRRVKQPAKATGAGGDVFAQAREVADGLPWFGEEPFLPSLVSRPPPNATADLPYVRRILVSWLVGRPVSQVAERAGCSSRHVYKVISHYLYAEPGELGWALEQWLELGLVTAISPSWPGEAPIRSRGRPAWFRPGDVTVACLVCHRLIGSLEYDWTGGEVDGEGPAWIQDTAGLVEWARSGANEYSIGQVQGHLLCHFTLQHDPVPRRAVNSLDEMMLSLMEVLGTANGKLNRRLRAIARSRSWVNVHAQVKSGTSSVASIRCSARLPGGSGAS